MKILMAVDAFVPISEYFTIGSVKAPIHLAKSLAAKGHDVSILCNADVLLPELHDTKLINVPSGRTHLKNSFRIIEDIGHEYEVIHINNSTPSTVSYINKSFHKDKMIFTLHTDPNTKATSYQYKLDHQVLNEENLCRLVFVSNTSKEVYHKLTETDSIESEVIYNGVANPGIQYNSSFEIAYGKYAILVARIEPSKNVLMTIDSVMASNLNLVILGDRWKGTPEGYYKEFLVKVNKCYDNRVFWQGNMDHLQTLIHLAHARVNVAIPTLGGFPLTTIESYYVGTPTLGWEYCPAICEQIDLIGTPSVAIAKRALHRMRYHDKCKVIGKQFLNFFAETNSRHINQNLFSLDSMVSEYEKLYRKRT